jgi:hypothetical protein
MGQSYSLPEKICSTKQVYEFYNNNWKTILYSNGDCEIYNKFKTLVSDEQESLREYLGAAIYNTKDVENFTKHLLTTKEGTTFSDYIGAMTNVNIDMTQKENPYEEFWNNPEGMERAAKIIRKPSQRDTSNIIEILQNISGEKSQKVHNVNIFAPTCGAQNQNKLDPCIIIGEVAKMLDVQISRSTLNLLNLWEYWNGLQKYNVYDNGVFMGYFYLKERTDSGQSCTIPLIPAGEASIPTSLVYTKYDYNLPHEITHAVHYCFVPFWDVSKEIVEIPAMMVERYFRIRDNNDFSPEFRRKQIGIALADLLSNDPDEFNTNYEKYANVFAAGHIASRFWHYAHYDKKYYSYVLGICMPENQLYQVKNLVRQSEYLNEVLSYINH